MRWSLVSAPVSNGSMTAETSVALLGAGERLLDAALFSGSVSFSPSGAAKAMRA